MIEKYFSDELRKKYPTWNVSEDFYEAKDNIIAVYSESGESTDPDNETNPLRPSYMIWLSSTKWEDTKRMAYEIYKMFHNQRNFLVTNYDGVTFRVNMIVAEQTPNRIGVEDRKLQYSINFNTHIREVI